MGPLGNPVQATFGRLNDGVTAVIEMAQASGLPLVPEHLRDPRKTTTYGFGEMIRYALESGARKLLLGIGGSATNDGGMGMLMALGVKFLDGNGHALSPIGGSLSHIATVDMSEIISLPRGDSFVVICDVTNLLLGERGATYVYGPQKGATPAICEELENGMRQYASVISKAVSRDIATFPGAGAAGGLGAALGGVLDATLRSGVDTILDAAGFDEILNHSDLVITGEGRLDGQSIQYGKAPVGVAYRCREKGIPIIAIVGGMGDGGEKYLEIGHSSIQVTVNDTMSLPQALSNAEKLYLDAADRVFRTLKIGMHISQIQEPCNFP